MPDDPWIYRDDQYGQPAQPTAGYDSQRGHLQYQRMPPQANLIPEAPRAPQGPQFRPAAPAQPPAAPARPPQPARAPARPAAAVQRKQGAGRKIGCAVAAAIPVALVAWFLVSVYGGSSGSFKTTVTGSTAVSPAELAVSFKVTNTGSTAATPTCTVDASDSTGAYSGVNEGTLDNPVQPGQTTTTAIDVTITNQGASYVTSVTVSC